MKDYSNLPMIRDEDEIRSHVHEILREAELDPTLSAVTIAEALNEMNDRQSTTYVRGFLSDVEAAIEEWLVRSWDPNSFDFVDAAVSLVPLRHGSARRLLEETAAKSTDPRAREIAAQTVAELELDDEG